MDASVMYYVCEAHICYVMSIAYGYVCSVYVVNVLTNDIYS